jgi:hypothetical protein
MFFKKAIHGEAVCSFLRDVLFFLFFCMSSLAFSQNGLFLSGSIDIGGLGRSYQFEQDGAILKRTWLGTKKNDIGILYSPELNVSYRFANHFGISLNLKLTDKAAVFHDTRFVSANGVTGVDYKANRGRLVADSGNFNPNRNFIGPNFSAAYFFNKNQEEFGLYLMAGFGINRILGNKGNSILSYYHQPSDELLELQLNYKKVYPYGYVEIGYSNFLDHIIAFSKKGPKITTKGAVLGVGFRYTFAGQYMSADYRVMKNSILQYTDKITLGGSYFSVVIKAGGSIFGSKIDKHHKRVYNQSLERENLAKKEREERMEEMRSRDVSLKQEIVVHNPRITLSVWDDLKYDGDVITLDLNGTLLLEDYSLKLQKKTIELILDSETNALVLHAISEGKQKPCTVALLIDDGLTKQKIILNSNMKTSEAISIRLAK